MSDAMTELFTAALGLVAPWHVEREAMGVAVVRLERHRHELAHAGAVELDRQAQSIGIDTSGHGLLPQAA